MLAEFTTQTVPVRDGEVLTRSGGSGPVVVLLHGFPETHLMWRAIAPDLARDHTVVLVDLPGYGGSPVRVARPDGGAKRVMAEAVVTAMSEAGHQAFAVVGHDRGGRVGYRLALDRPDVVTRLAVLDIVPTDAVWDQADADLALGYWPWVLLAQDPPLPERILTHQAETIVDAALGGWGSAADTFPDAVRMAYVEALRAPGRAEAICAEYRAAAGLDRDHDAADRSAGRRIGVPLLALWSAAGPVGQWYDELGGPLALWRGLADQVSGEGVAGGHFFPEEHPVETAARLRSFLAGS